MDKDIKPLEGIVPPGGEKKVSITVDGKKYDLTEKELTDYAQQGYHYTQQMQGLRQQEKDLKAQVATDATQLFESWLKEIAQQNPAADPSSGGEVDPIAQRLAAMEKQLTELSGHQEKNSNALVMAEVDRIMGGLVKQFPHANRILLENRFMREAGANDDPEKILERFAKEAEETYTKDMQSHIDEFVKSKSSPPAGAEAGGAGGAGLPEGDGKPPPKDFGEARERAEAFIQSQMGKVPMI